MNNQITKIKLTNGLSVLLKEIHTAPIVSSWIWYRVGSRNEHPGITGASHWVEHMLFKGTQKFPSKQLDRVVAREGGYWNAFTFKDWTAYFETLPAGRYALGLEIEADRMVNAEFDPEEIESERSIIISEMQGNENQPLFRLTKEVMKSAFQVHPYRNDTAGRMKDINTMTRDDLYEYYQKHYIPGNAVLSISGDFDTEKITDEIHSHFGNIPSGTATPHPSYDEPEQESEQRVEMSGPGETTYVLISYRAPEASHPDFFSVVVMDSLLTGPSNFNLLGGGISNKTSRLYRTLVDNEIAVGFHGGIHATIDPYTYEIVTIVHPKRSPEDVIQTVENEISRLQETPPQASELERAVKQARAIFAYGSENITNHAFWMGLSETINSYAWFTGFLDRIESITPEDVQRSAQTYLRNDNRVIGIYRPEEIST